MDYEKFVETLMRDIETTDEDYCRSARAYDEQEYANKACACRSVIGVMRECVKKHMKPLDIALKLTSLANNFYIRSKTIHHESVGLMNYCDLLPEYMFKKIGDVEDMLFDYYVVFDTFAKRAEELAR